MKYFKYIFLFILSCKPIELNVTDSVLNIWIAPEEDIELIEKFMDSTEVCIKFNSYTNYVEVQTSEITEYLEYELVDDIYNVQYIGGVSFEYKDEEWFATFDNQLINNKLENKEVKFKQCIPWR